MAALGEAASNDAPASARRDGLPLQGTPSSVLVAVAFACCLGTSPAVMFGPILPVLKAKLCLGLVEAALLGACPGLLGSLLRLVAGPLADSMDQRRMLTALMALASLGMLGVAVVMGSLEPGLAPHAYWALLCMGLLAGCGCATFIVGTTQVSYWYPVASQGGTLGLLGSVASLSPPLMAHLLPRSLALFGFFRSYAMWTAMLVVGTLMYNASGHSAWFFQLQGRGLTREKARLQATALGQELFPPEAADAMKSFRTAASSGQTWALVGLYASGLGGQMTLLGWLPTFWHEAHGLTLEAAGTLTAAFGITACLVRASAGPASDRLGGVALTTIGLALAAAGACPMFLSCGIVAEVAGQEIMAVGTAAISAAVFKLVPQHVPQSLGGAFGLVAGLGAFGGFALLPVVACFPHALGRPGYAMSFAVFPALMFAALPLVAALWLADRRQTKEGDRASVAHGEEPDDSIALLRC